MSRRSPRGYTVMEVMMALAILTIGASGVIAVQKATMIGNTNARNLATANSIAQSWVERLRADALVWNAPANADDIGDTNWLKSADPANPNTPWIAPACSASRTCAASASRTTCWSPTTGPRC